MSDKKKKHRMISPCRNPVFWRNFVSLTWLIQSIIIKRANIFIISVLSRSKIPVTTQEEKHTPSYQMVGKLAVYCMSIVRTYYCIARDHFTCWSHFYSSIFIWAVRYCKGRSSFRLRPGPCLRLASRSGSALPSQVAYEYFWRTVWSILALSPFPRRMLNHRTQPSAPTLMPLIQRWWRRGA